MFRLVITEQIDRQPSDSIHCPNTNNYWGRVIAEFASSSFSPIIPSFRRKTLANISLDNISRALNEDHDISIISFVKIIFDFILSLRIIITADNNEYRRSVCRNLLSISLLAFKYIYIPRIKFCTMFVPFG